MSIRSGLAGQIGVAAETVYGTPVTPSRFIEGTTSIKDTSTWAVGGGVAAGRMQRLASQRVRTAYGAAGNLVQDVTTKGMGLLLQALMGTAVTPTQQGASGAYLQSHVLGDPYGKSLSIQTGVPDLQGSVRPYTAVGAKILSGEFSCGVGEFLTANFTVDARELIESLALGAAAYPARSRFHWAQSSIKVGPDLASVAAVDGVRGVNVKFDRPSRTDRNYAGNGGRKSEAVINDWQAVTGSLDADFMDKTLFVDRFHSGGSFGLVWEFTGATIGGGFSETFRVKLGGCVMTGDTPELGGPDVVTGPQPFEWYFDGTNQPVIDYISTDTTV